MKINSLQKNLLLEVLGKMILFLISIPVAMLSGILSFLMGGSRIPYQKAIKALIRLSLGRYELEISGSETFLNIPAPYIIAAGHFNDLDWLALYSWIDADISLVADDFLVGLPYYLMTKRAGFLPLKNSASFLQAKNLCNVLKAIEDKRSVIMFTNKSSSGFDMRPGVAYLSIKTGAPVIPVRVREIRNKIFRITAGSPLYPDDGNIDKCASFTARIRDSIISLE